MNQPALKHALPEANILLIEDNESDAELTIAAFGETGGNHAFHTINNGESAIDFLHKKGAYRGAVRPDLILLDLNLPKKNGWEILHNIKNDSALKTIPVVVLTNSADEKDITMCYMLHANCYIVKPLGYGEFARTVESMEQFWLRTARRPS